jgi:hypothetical protein
VAGGEITDLGAVGDGLAEQLHILTVNSRSAVNRSSTDRPLLIWSRCSTSGAPSR